jgi:hypothetical protein
MAERDSGGSLDGGSNGVGCIDFGLNVGLDVGQCEGSFLAGCERGKKYH